MADASRVDFNEKTGLPVYVKSERSGPYISAQLNPDIQSFDTTIRAASKKVFEIGCGTSPRLSYQLGKNDVWVGCDPYLMGNFGRAQVHRGSIRVDSSAELIAFSEKAQDVPQFTPDVFVMVAPNPKDVAEDKMLPGLEKFLGRKKQTFIIALDQRTHEAVTQKYLEDAQTKINLWMQSNGFRRAGMPHEFKANSADLGGTGSNRVACWTRG